MAQAVPPGDGLYRVSINQMQDDQTHPYFVDERTRKIYHLGKEIVGDAADLPPATSRSTPPVGREGAS